MAITGRSALLAVIGVPVVLAVGSGWAIPGWAALVVVLCAVDLWLAGSVRDVVIERSGATRARLGESAIVVMSLRNAGRRTVRALVRDAWPPSAGVIRSRSRLRIPPRERRLIETTLAPSRRGERRGDLITVRSLGPLGLAARQRSRDVPWSVKVLPPFTSRRLLPEKLARLRQIDSLVPTNVRGQGTEFDSLRDYVAGDDVRSIDWRATARRDAVVVRTWRPERDRHILIVLDTSRTAAARVGDEPRLDAALDAALLLGAVAARAGDRVQLLAFDQAMRASVSVGGAKDVLRQLAETIAPLQPELVEPDPQAMVRAILARVPQRSLVVLFTTLDAAVAQEGLIQALPPLLRRHRVVLASVADPTLHVMAGTRSDAAAVFAAAAAEHALDERRMVADQLRQRGVHVVDAPVDRFASAVTDAYLNLKSAGGL